MRAGTLRHFSAAMAATLLLAGHGTAGAADPDSELRQAVERPGRLAQVGALQAAAKSGRVTLGQALMAMTTAEVARWGTTRPGVDSALRRQEAARELLSKRLSQGLSPIPPLAWPYDQAARAFAPTAARPPSPSGVQQALALRARRGEGPAVHGKLDVRAAAALIVLALGPGERAPGLGWAADLDETGRAWLRSQLVSRRHLTDRQLGRATAVAIALAGTRQKALIAGIIDAPGMADQPTRRNAIVIALLRGLAHVDYLARHRWESLYLGTVRPWLMRLHDGGNESERRAAASFGVWRAEALGQIDRVATDSAKLALARNQARPVFVGEAHQLYRRLPHAGAAMLKLAGVTPPRFRIEGPWNLRERAWIRAEEHCGPLTRPAAQEAASSQPPPDPKQLAYRQIVREGTAKMLAKLDAYKGKPSQHLSFRRCEAWLRRYDTEAVGSPERKKALDTALPCLKAHTAAFPADDPSRLEYARVLDDSDKESEATRQLSRLVSASDERSRILGSYRLLGRMQTDTKHPDRAPISRALAAKAAKLVSKRGFNHHQRTYAELVLAWLDATSGRAKEAFERLAKLLEEVRNPRDDTVLFANVGGLIDYTSKVSVLAEIPPMRMVGLYGSLPSTPKRSALMQLAHLYARHGRARDIETLAGAMDESQLPSEAAVLLVDARLREYGPRSTDQATEGQPMFDEASAKAALTQLERLESIRNGADKMMATVATCVLLGYAGPVATTLTETKQFADARRVLERALSVAKREARPALLLQLADTEQGLGNDGAAIRIYGDVLTAHPELATARPLVLLDYYQAAFRAAKGVATPDRARAGALVAKHIEPIALAIITSFKGKDRRELLATLRETASYEGHWQALARLAATLRERGELAAARHACYSAARGEAAAAVSKAGLDEHFAKADGRELDGPARCLDAAWRPETPKQQAAIGEARTALAKALTCADDTKSRASTLLLGAELARLEGDLDETERTLERVRRLKSLPVMVNSGFERLAWSSLLAGRLEAAEKHLMVADAPAATLWAAHIAYADRRFEVAAARFAAVAQATGDPAGVRIWEARSRLASGDVPGWRAGLASLAKRRDPAVTRTLIAELDSQASAQPGAAKRLLKRLARKWPAAKARAALSVARTQLNKKIRPLAAKKHRRVGRALRTSRVLSSRLVKLLKTLKPALGGSKNAKPDAAALIQALDIVVGGLEAMHSFLAQHEPLLGKSRKRAVEINRALDGLERQAIHIGQSALGTARKQAFASPTLRRLAARLARRYPETFGQTVPWAMVCTDELPTAEVAVAGPVPKALVALLGRGHGALVGALAETCAPPGAATSTDWQALHFAAVTARSSTAPPEVRAAAASKVAGRKDANKSLSGPTRAALAAHFAGVDCERTVALAKGLTAMPAAVQRAVLACKGDVSGLRAHLKQARSARGLRRLAALIADTADTPADAERVVPLIERAAVLAGMKPATLITRPWCELPTSEP